MSFSSTLVDVHAGLGLKLVIVLGHQVQIDERLAQMGHPSRFVGGYRVTDAMALRAAVESSGLTRMQVTSLATCCWLVWASEWISQPLLEEHLEGCF